MKLYFAIAPNKADNEYLFRFKYKYFLFSYFYFAKNSPLEYLNDKDFFLNEHIFLDSGAFSALTLNKPIILRNYIRYIKRYKVKLYASLDVIGDPVKTAENDSIMINEGLNPIPTFHMGESIEWLDKIIDREYIALGNMVQSQNIEVWLDNVFNYVYKKNPNIKIHGFGLTNPNLILKYPWYSIDSSTWASCVRFARFSWWMNHRNRFEQISAIEFFKRENIPYYDGEPIIKEKRKLIITRQVEHFLKMNDFLLNKKTDKDYSYITAQQTLF